MSRQPLWHSIHRFALIPAKYSSLSARSLSPAKRQPEFADMRLPLTELLDYIRGAMIATWSEHSLLYSRGSMDFRKCRCRALP